MPGSLDTDWIGSLDKESSADTLSAAAVDATAKADAAEAALTGVAQVTPNMTLYEERSDWFYKVVFQDGDTLYSVSQDSTGTIRKSTDNGATWTTKGNVGASVKALMRLSGTGTLIVVGNGGGVYRSTNDGTTWTLITTLNYSVLGPQGICSTPSGHVLIGEYGNDGNTVYRVMRSTDDGQTFSAVLSSPGTDAAADPGHFHSVVYDDWQDAFIAFMDRPNPEHYVSEDEGATWTKVGTSTTTTHPNWVAPMFFEDYIAWGYDNQRAGVFARIPRADYYAGNFASAEDVAEVNRKVFYHSFPIRADMWVSCGATELLGVWPEGPGSYGQEVYIVHDNGSKVAPGVEHMSPDVVMGTLDGAKPRPPSYPHDKLDQGGEAWLNFYTSNYIREYAAVPYSVGTTPPMRRTTPSRGLTPVLLRNGEYLYGLKADGTRKEILRVTSADRIEVADRGDSLRAGVAKYETIPRHAVSQSIGALSSGRVTLVAIELPSGLVVTSITFASGTTAANGPTIQWFSLHDSSRNLLRQTVDHGSNSWNGNTLKTLALTSTFTTTYSGLHYLGIMVTATTAVPTLASNANTGAVAPILGLDPILAGTADTGLTTSAPNPAAALTAINGIPYAYVS